MRSDLALPNHFATRVYRLKWMRINPPLDKLFDKKVRLTLIIYYSHVKILPRLSCADSFLILLKELAVVKLKYLEAVEVKNMEEPPRGA